MVDQAPLEPNTKYTVYETDAAGNQVPRSEAYTDGDGNVTHVTNVTPEDPGAPAVDPNENVDLTRPDPGVTHKVELGFDEPHIFTGEPHTGGDEGMAPAATRFDPPPDATPVRWPGTYDVGADGPFSARQDLPPNSRIEVRGPDGKLHGVFWTDANRQVTHVRTWYGDREHGYNPELGDSNRTVKKWGVPRPDTHYLVEPHDRFQTADPNPPLDPPDAARTGDFGDNGVEPGTFLFHTDDRGQTDTASGRPEYDTPHSDEEQRNDAVQKKVGHIGKGTGEYPGGRFDGGHIFPHEGRGPGERINYFPQWSPTNRGNSGTGLLPSDTWRQSFESLLEQRHTRNPDVTIERIDFFPEPNDPRITPEVVHTRWTETDNSQNPPVTTTHYRSYHNLDPSQRGGGGTTPPASSPPGGTAPPA
ncbi:hypothetical protein, partial [Actinomadura sp. 7K534]|uniref:hypothetical protein n=1 Tax=Actinomadura sp. 7K534 TaxID=2530366 RepID=UPI0010E32118